MFKTVTTAIVTAALLAGCGQTPAAQDSAPSATTAAAPLTTPVEVLGITSHPYWAPAHVEVVDGKVQITSAPGVGAFTAELPLPEAARCRLSHFETCPRHEGVSMNFVLHRA